MSTPTQLDILIQIRDLLLSQSEIWTINTFCAYTGYEKSYVYKLTSQRKIPHHKPSGGKTITFKKADVLEFMTANRIKTRGEISTEAEQIIKNNKKLLP